MVTANSGTGACCSQRARVKQGAGARSVSSAIAASFDFQRLYIRFF
jgi:hypothetical protein